MAGDSGLNALSLLPENVLPQWQQKIASQKIFIRPYQRNIWGRMDFLHEVQFFAGIGPAHFPAETTRPLRPRLSAIFTLLLYPCFVCQMAIGTSRKNIKNI